MQSTFSTSLASKSPIGSNLAFLLFLLTWSWVQASSEFMNDNLVGRGESGGHPLVGIDVPAQLMAKRSRLRLCGNQLANAIKITCFVKQSRGKRSIDDISRPYYNGMMSPEFEAEWQQAEAMAAQALMMQRPTLGGSNMASLPQRFQTVDTLQSLNKRGAADECCHRPCTMAHLETYC